MSLIRAKREFSLVQSTTSNKLGPGVYNVSSAEATQLSVAPFGSTNPRSVTQPVDQTVDGPAPGYYQPNHQSTNHSSKQLSSQFSSQVDRFNHSNQSNSQLGPGSYSIPSSFQSNNQSIIQSVNPTTVFIERSSTAPSIPSKLDQSIYGYTIDQSNKLIPQRPHSVNQSITQSTNQSTNQFANQSTSEYPAPGQYNPNISLTHPGTSGAISYQKSKSEREFNQKNAHRWVPGVGAYSPDGGKREKMTRSSSMFQTVPRSAFKPSATPGPGTYDMASTHQSINQSNNANFGATQRSEMVNGKFATPGPGSYTGSAPKKPHHQRAATSQSSRFPRDHREGLPGPGAYGQLVDHVQEHGRYHFSVQNSFGTLAPRFISSKPITAPGPCDYQSINPSNQHLTNQPITAAHKPVPSAAFHSVSKRFTADEKEPLKEDESINQSINRSTRHVNQQVVRPLSSFASFSSRFDDFTRVGSALPPNQYLTEQVHTHYHSDDIRGASAVFKSVTNRSFDKMSTRASTANTANATNTQINNDMLGPGCYQVNGSSFQVKSFNVTIP